MLRSIAIFLILLVIIIGLPLLGSLVWGDRPAAYYLDFPPGSVDVEHAPFSWTAFFALAAVIILLLLPFIRQAVRWSGGNDRASEKGSYRPFPWWGYAGAALCIAAWVLAWNRFSWFAEHQTYTFPLLWIGYIIVVNALTYKRTGTCLVLKSPVFFLFLFPASAVFWWFFEYLNRFVGNWYYAQVHVFGPVQYVFYASVCFATVLPGVLSTAELFRSIPFFQTAYRDFISIRPAHPKAVATVILIVSAAGLFALGLWPNLLFPLLWLSPLLVLVSLQTLAGQNHILSPVAHGEWTHLVSLAAAALVCGFFWEMWNYYSLARWEYSIPYVHRFLVFEMPVLGYAGYPLFGLECGAVGDVLKKLIGTERNRNASAGV